MICLCVDASGAAAGVAIVRDEQVLYEQYALCRKTHSATLMPMVETSLTLTGLQLSDLTCLGCVVGPGSYTGVRIGVSTVKGLAHGLHIPCVPVNGLEVIAAGAGHFDGWICPMLDARAGQVYAAAYRDGTQVLAPAALTLTDFLFSLPATARCLFTGDGAGTLRAAILSMKPNALFAPPPFSTLRPAVAASLALSRRASAVDYLHLEPMYLRLPQAERERAQREARA